MPVLVPTTLDEALTAIGVHERAMVLAGGTDLMVEVNDGRRRPDDVVVAVDRIPELRTWQVSGADDRSHVEIGACVTWTELADPVVAEMIPALAEAARTVGSPQIRNAGTIGGNLGTCSPAGDGLPVLAALDARVRLASMRGEREVPVAEFMVGPKQHALADDELILSVVVPVAAGWQGYAKVGVRNAMVIATASACLVLDTRAQRVAVALGSVGPTVLRCPGAEDFMSAELDWGSGQVDDAALRQFTELVGATARPRDDHRSSADYRRHAVGVLAGRLLRRGLDRLRTDRLGAGHG